MKSLAPRGLVGALLAALGWACGGETLDLGRSGPGGTDGATRYATPATIAAEADAGPGIPTEIASHPDGAVAVAVDDERVYWSQELGSNTLPDPAHRGLVRSCVKNDCAATVIVYAATQVAARHIAVNKTHVFWNSVQHLFTCPIGGCRQAPTLLTSEGLLNFVVDDSNVYVLTNVATILRCPIEGCQNAPTIVASVGQVLSTASSTAFAMDVANLYWIEGDSISSAPGSIMTVPKDGSEAPHAVGHGGHLVNSLASNGTQLFWAESHHLAAVKWCGLPSCLQEPTTLSAPQRYPHFLTLSDGFAYWFVAAQGDASSTWPPGHLVECPLAGCGSTPTVLVSDQFNPTDIAVDATHVYWSNYTVTSASGSSTGAVRRIRRSR